MGEMDERLLDRIAAKRAQEIVDTAIGRIEGSPKDKATAVDNLVTKALGVLQENGVYACFLFLFSRTQEKEQKIAEVVREELLALAASLRFGWGEPDRKDASTVLAHVSNTICAELDPLLMAKTLFEQTLIYARYGAKAQKQSVQERREVSDELDSVQDSTPTV
jgi:hypothetical protein